jgi:hypothetical protein
MTGTTNDRDNQQRGQPTTGTTNNGERQTTGNDKRQGTTIGGEQQTAGNNKQRGTANDGERRATGNNKRQGTTNGREQQTAGNNERTNSSRTTLATNTRWWVYFRFLFLFQIYILVTLHHCEQLLAGCLCIYLFRIHNQIKLVVPKKRGENRSKPVFWTATEPIEPVLIGSVTV